MHFFDAHCDILSVINTPGELLSNKRHWDIKRALSNGPFFQVFSLFAQGGNPLTRKKKMEDQLKMVRHAESLHPDRLKMVKSREDLNDWLNKKDGNQVRYMIESEGAEIIGESLSELDRLYDEGLRILTLSWNYDNAVCDSVAGNNTHNGLSRFGRKVVERAESLGIILSIPAPTKPFQMLKKCKKTLYSFTAIAGLYASTGATLQTIKSYPSQKVAVL